MTKPKVYLSSTSLEMTNNQNQFIINPYIEHIKEQKETNLQLLNAISKLNKSCETILKSIHKQQVALNVHKISQRHHQTNIRNSLLDIALDLQELQANFTQQERSLQKIIYRLANQSHKKDALILSQKILEKIEVQEDNQQDKAIHTVKYLLEKLLQEKAHISELLSSFPPNYPVKQLVVSGITVPVKYFLLLNEEKGIAVFSNGSQTIYVAVDKIDTIHCT